VISGTPTTVGISTFTVQVTDGIQTVTEPFALTVSAALVITTTSPLPAGIQNLAYTATLAATGGTGSYTWSVTAGTLPAGLTLASATGILSGTPIGAGTSNFTVQATDGLQAVAAPFALTVIGALVITTTSPLPGAVEGQAYSTTLTGEGGVPATYAWEVTAGSLPSGLSLEGTSGAITGTPTIDGTSDFTIQLTDGSQTTAKAFSLKVRRPRKPD